MKTLDTQGNSNIFTTKKLILMAFLSAISIILTRFFSFMIGETIRISFGYIPIMISGIFLGPLAGGLTGVVSDLAGIMIRAEGGFFPGFILSYALIGIIPGLVFKYLKADKHILFKIIVSVLTVEIFVALILNTYWLNLMLGQGFLAVLPARIVARLIIAPVEIFVLYYLLKKESVRELFESIND